jgi:hypothetical protein
MNSRGNQCAILKNAQTRKRPHRCHRRLFDCIYRGDWSARQVRFTPTIIYVNSASELPFSVAFWTKEKLRQILVKGVLLK